METTVKVTKMAFFIWMFYWTFPDFNNLTFSAKQFIYTYFVCVTSRSYWWKPPKIIRVHFYCVVCPPPSWKNVTTPLRAERRDITRNGDSTDTGMAINIFLAKWGNFFYFGQVGASAITRRLSLFIFQLVWNTPDLLCISLDIIFFTLAKQL